MGQRVNIMSCLKVRNHCEYEVLRRELETARNELKNIRQQLHKQKSVHDKEVKSIKHMLNQIRNDTIRSEIPENTVTTESTTEIYNMHPIGFIKSWFKCKNGTPRQPTVCPETKAFLQIEKSVFSNPEHSLIGLEEFSYVWILFVFHENKSHGSFHKTKVHPPRLNGTSVGVFSTRSPHRHNAIGLSLTKLEKVEGDTLFLSGVDMLDGTPVLDIKPFIPSYDIPCYNENSLIIQTLCQSSEVGYTEPKTCDLLAENWQVSGGQEFVSSASEDNGKNSRKHEDLRNMHIQQDEFLTRTCDLNNMFSEKSDTSDQGQTEPHSVHKCCEKQEIALKNKAKNFLDNSLSDCVENMTTVDNSAVNFSIASWLKVPPVSLLDVSLTKRAHRELQRFHNNHSHEGKCQFCFSFLKNTSEARLAVTKLLQQDPRSVYRRKNCADRLYYFCVDTMHVTCWFDDDLPFTQVLKIKPAF